MLSFLREGDTKLNIMRKWIKLIRWIKKHRAEGNASFDVVTNSDTFVITVRGCESTRESWDKNMLRIKY